MYIMIAACGSFSAAAAYFLIASGSSFDCSGEYSGASNQTLLLGTVLTSYLVTIPEFHINYPPPQTSQVADKLTIIRTTPLKRPPKFSVMCSIRIGNGCIWKDNLVMLIS